MDRKTVAVGTLGSLVLASIFFFVPVWGKTPYRHLMDYWHYNQATEELNEAKPAVNAILSSHSMRTKGQRQRSQPDQAEPEITREQYEAGVKKIAEFQNRAEGDWPQSARWLITTVLNDELSFGSRHVASSFLRARAEVGQRPDVVSDEMFQKMIDLVNDESIRGSLRFNMSMVVAKWADQSHLETLLKWHNDEKGRFAMSVSPYIGRLRPETYIEDFRSYQSHSPQKLARLYQNLQSVTSPPEKLETLVVESIEWALNQGENYRSAVNRGFDALGSFETERSRTVRLNYLQDAVSSDPQSITPRNRRSLVTSFLPDPPPEARPHLEQILQDSSWRTLWEEALQGLGALGADQADPVIRKTFKRVNDEQITKRLKQAFERGQKQQSKDKQDE